MSEQIYRVQMNRKGMPNFSTAEPIVRCKECKYWYGESEMYEDREYKKCWQLQGQYMNSDFWCKYGERSGDE